LIDGIRFFGWLAVVLVLVLVSLLLLRLFPLSSP